MSEKIGIPVNVALAAAVLVLLFRGVDLGARTTTVSIEIGGETVERTVAKPEFRKRTALTRFSAAPGLGEDEHWLTHMAPFALELDLAADDFFEPIPASLFNRRLADFGLQSAGDVPLPLRWAVAELLHATFIVSGTVDRSGEGYRVTMNIDNTDIGQRIGETVHEGPDFLALVDEMSETLAEALDLPDRDGIEDLPVRDRLTENEAALAAFGRAHAKRFADPPDLEAAIEGLRAATALDPTFAVAQYHLSVAYLDDIRPEEATAALRAAIDHLYRLPERMTFQARGDYYFLTEQLERGWAIVEMWVALHPEDPTALDHYGLMQSIRGDWQGLTRTIETRYRLSPANHSLLKELAGAHENLGDDEGALAALERYVRRMPADYTGHVDLARIHRRLGTHEIARKHLERAIIVDPLNPDPVGELASLDLRLGRFEEAWVGLERARELARTSRQSAGVFDQLKEYYRFRGQMEDAIRTADAWLETVSGVYIPLVIAQRRFADISILLEAGRREHAATLFETLRSQLGLDAPENDPYYVARWRIRLALEAGGSAAARAAHSDALDWNRTWQVDMIRLMLLVDLGRIEETVGNYEEAILQYRDALSLDDGMVDVHRWLGGALRKAGRLDEAEAECREALRLVPADPHSHLEMAKVLEARGDNEGAVTHLGRALAAWEPADESFEPAREARSKLAELEGRPRSGTGDGHAGLAGMRERAEAVGGGLNVRTSPGTGTMVRAPVPMAHPDGARW
ncbi:MAG: tetratricopeptide repeat protein [Gemmatimonadota bacterium]|nr:tetratricopeptide repeat protein [Gemmatimonadota bacterium]